MAENIIRPNLRNLTIQSSASDIIQHHISFGLHYGLGDRSLEELLPTSRMTPKEAKEILQKWFTFHRKETNDNSGENA